MNSDSTTDHEDRQFPPLRPAIIDAGKNTASTETPPTSNPSPCEPWDRNDKIQAGLLAVGIAVGLIAMGQGWLTYQAVELTRTQIHDGLRAYVLVDKAELGTLPVVGEPLTVRITLRNTGQTPAIALSAGVVPMMAPNVPMRIAQSSMQGRPSINVGAGQVRVIGLGQEMKFSENDIAGMIGKTLRLRIIGKIAYTDVFGRNQETEFCLTYIGLTELDFCDTGNTMREGQPQPQDQT